MRCPASLPLAVALIVTGSLPLPASAQSAVANVEGGLAASVAACERAARQTFGVQAPRDLEVSLNAGPAVQPSLAGDSQTVLRGSGRWRGNGATHTFSYTCNVDRGTSEALGFVMRDSTPAPAEAAAPRASLEPDLSELSPAACESSAVVALQQRWPRVSKITFDSATRSLRQPSANRAEFHGSGLALPAPGSPTTVFEFDCAIDPRDGRVLQTSLAG